MIFRSGPVWLIVLGCMASQLLAQQPSDSTAKRIAQRQQCRAWLLSAMDLRKQGNPAEALPALDSVLLCDGKNPDAYYLKAQILSQIGDTAGALTVLQKGVAEAPLSARIKLYLARLLIAKDDVGQATPLVDAVLTIKPREGEALYLRGLLYMKQGNDQQALDNFELALKYGLEPHAR